MDDDARDWSLYTKNCKPLRPMQIVKANIRAGKPRLLRGVAVVEEVCSVVSHGKGVNTAARVVAERVIGRPVNGVIQPPPTPTSDFSGVRRYFATLSKMIPRPALMTLPEVAETFKACKVKLYRNAAISLSRVPLQLKDSRLTCFVKYEKHLRSGGLVPTARMISPRSPRFNLSVARYLKPVEKGIYAAIDKSMGIRTVMKGLNNVERAEAIEEHWARYSDPIAIGLDASRFDQHVSEAALRAEHSLYTGIYPNVELRNLLECQIDNYCTCYCPDGTLKWATRGGRMSGDMNTSLGNIALSCAMFAVYRDEINIKASLINDGDDCLVLMERRDETIFRAGLNDFYLRHGFTMKVEPTARILEEIEFCQCKMVFNGERYILSRNYSKVLRQDALGDGPLDTVNAIRKWAYQVAVGCGRDAGGIPILQEYYSCLKGFGLHHKFKMDTFERSFNAVQNMTHGAVETRAITDESRLSFYLAYGVNPTQQREWERYLKGILTKEAANVHTALTACDRLGLLSTDV